MKVEFESIEISVIIPLYNKKNSIIGALNSVFRQTHPPSEIIVVNDGSTDGSELLVRSLCHPLIKLVNQKNAGVSAARNKGIELARCKWVAFLDADDFWETTYLNTIKKLHLEFEKAKVLATSYRYQLFTGKFVEIKLNKIDLMYGETGILNNYFEVSSYSNPPIFSSAVVVYNESLLDIGGFPLRVKSGEDLITWAKLALDNEIAYSTKVGATFVLDPAHSYDDKPNRFPQQPDIVGNELKRLYNENKKTIGFKKYVSHWHKMRASIYIRLDLKKEAFHEIIIALKYNLLNYKLYAYLILLLLPLKLRINLFKKLGN